MKILINLVVSILYILLINVIHAGSIVIDKGNNTSAIVITYTLIFKNSDIPKVTKFIIFSKDKEWRSPDEFEMTKVTIDDDFGTKEGRIAIISVEKVEEGDYKPYKIISKIKDFDLPANDQAFLKIFLWFYPDNSLSLRASVLVFK